jgi:hypothetical protein
MLKMSVILCMLIIGAVYDCPVHKDGSTEVQIMCYTPQYVTISINDKSSFDVSFPPSHDKYHCIDQIMLKMSVILCMLIIGINKQNSQKTSLL